MFVKQSLAILVLLVLTLCTPLQSVAKDLSYNEIVFFGDSLTDNGNLYKKLLGIAPKPPYYEGRFTNGPTWAENVAAYFEHEHNIKSQNNAVGGSTTTLHSPFKGYFPFTLSETVNSYLITSPFKDKSHTLYIIWIGSNDYLYCNGDVEKTTADVIANIKLNIEKLVNRGAKNFLVMNLADIARTPQGLTGGITQNVADLTNIHNTKLAALVTEFQNKHKDINFKLFDTFVLSSDLFQYPEKYNELLKTKFSILSEACWRGSYLRGNNLNQIEDLTNSIEQKIRSQELTSNSPAYPSEQRKQAEQMARFITNSPDLSTAYDVSENYEYGSKACKNPDNYIFWDKVHPTAAVHSIFSTVIIDFINQNFP